MILPRIYQQTDAAVCLPGRRCVVNAAVGVEPLENKGQSGSMGPPDFEKPGPHRYIGIGMVAGMILIVLLLWLALGKWPRRMAKTYSCWKRDETRKGGKECVIEPCQMDVRKGTTQGRKSSLQAAWMEISGHKAGIGGKGMVDWKMPDMPCSVHHEV